MAKRKTTVALRLQRREQRPKSSLHITPRQREILRMVALGHINREDRRIAGYQRPDGGSPSFQSDASTQCSERRPTPASGPPTQLVASQLRQ